MHITSQNYFALLDPLKFILDAKQVSNYSDLNLQIRDAFIKKLLVQIVLLLWLLLYWDHLLQHIIRYSLLLIFLPSFSL